MEPARQQIVNLFSLGLYVLFDGRDMAHCGLTDAIYGAIVCGKDFTYDWCDDHTTVDSLYSQSCAK